MKNNPPHLSDDQFLDCLVNESGISAQVRDHLAGCRSCRENISAVQEELVALNQIARKCIPPFHRQLAPVNLPKKWMAIPGARPVFAISVIIVLVLTGWALLRYPVPTSQDIHIASEMAQDRAFLLEIRSLEEQALSLPGCVFGEETNTSFSEEFIDFIAPLEKAYTGSGLFDGSYRKKQQTKESIT